MRASIKVRALALYQAVWEKVGRTYVDPTRLGDWGRWQHRFDAEIATMGDAERCIGLMLDSIGDDYTFLQTPDQVRQDKEAGGRRAFGIGVDLSTCETGDYPQVTAVTNGEPAYQKGLRVNDRIVSADGASCADMTLDEITARLRGAYGTAVSLVVQRGKRRLRPKLMRRSTCVDGSVEATLLPGGRIGIIKVQHFHHADLMLQLRTALNKLRGAQAFVLNLIDNGGGTIDLGLDLITFFLRSGQVATFETRNRKGAKEMQAVKVNTGRIRTRTKCGTKVSYRWRRRQRYFLNGRPLVICLNRATASTGELVSGCFKDNGFAVFGRTASWGKAIGQDYLGLPGGYGLVVTSLRWFTPAGVWGGDIGQTMRIGVIPTHAVECDEHEEHQAVVAAAVAHLKRALRRRARTAARSL